VTTAGTGRCSTHLLQGTNIFKASATISGAELYSLYVVQGQAGLAAQLGASGVAGPDDASVQTGQIAEVADTSVPLYRPMTWMAETAGAQQSLQTQAQWHANYAIGRSAKAEVVVKGFRQADGRLFMINEMVTLTAPFLGVDHDLLIIGVQFNIDKNEGEMTTLTIAPVQAASPNPRDLRVRHKGKRGHCIANWDGAGGY
jgi:prophage tail gpP-like protein